jgi:hypothetical protein
MRPIDRRMAQVDVDQANRDIKLWSPAMQARLQAKMRAARAAGEHFGIGPQMEAKAATEFFANAAQEVEPPQLKPVPVPLHQPVDQQLAQSGLQDPEEAAKAAAGDVHTAAVQSLGSGYKPSKIFSYWKRKIPIWGGVVLGMELMGRFSGYASVGLTMAGALGLRELFYAGVRESLRDNPAKMEATLNQLSQPNKLFAELRNQGRSFVAGTKAPPVSNELVTAMARAGFAVGLAQMNASQKERDDFAQQQRYTEQFGQAGAATGARERGAPAERAEGLLTPTVPNALPTPTVPNELPTPSGPGPGVSAADRMRSENVAPSRSSADSAQKLAMNVSKPTNPVDVSRDLASGRHSVDEVRKTLQFHNDPKATDVLAGMPLTDAMMATELASPEERPMLMQVLQMRLRQELPQVKNKTTQANLTKRMKQLQSMGETAVA